MEFVVHTMSTKPKQLIAVAAALALLLVACTATPTATPTASPTPTAVAAQPVAGASDGDGNGGPPPSPNVPVVVQAGLPDVASVVERVMPAVVQVLVEIETTDRFGRTSRRSAQGSGFFFDDRGYLLTNNHVVEDATSIEVALANRERIPAEVVGTDPETDLAVLKVDRDLVADFVVLTLGDTEAMRIGEWVIAIGSPLGFAGSVTVGVVSAKGRSLALDGDVQLRDLVQTDAVINPGNSGGPLLNLRGEVIGINTAIIRGRLSSGQEAEGIGFAISMRTAAPVSAQLIENGRMIRPRLGVSIADVTPILAAERDLAVDEGVLVLGLVAGAPAERAGIAVDDVIVAVDGTPVASTAELVSRFLTDYRLGDTVSVTVDRRGERLTFELVLEEVSF